MNGIRNLFSRFLRSANILNQDNRQTAANHQNPDYLAWALESLHRANILNQDNFTALLNSPALTNTQPNIFERIPDYLMNQNVFNDLLGLANNNAIQHYVNRLLGVTNNPNFNDQQSTHRASVHKSVSESASNLASRYHQIINNATAMESEIKKLKDAIWALPENDENNVAKRCIEKITAHEYTFTDPASKVSLRQLLALAYVAVNDETSRNGTIEDAINSLAKGLYEIQRGYNLNDQGIDQGGNDRPICTAGTFNKIIERLQGIHPDCHIQFITQGHAAMKLPIIAMEAAMEHLEGMEENTDSGAFVKTMRNIQKDGIGIIWNAIEDEVKDRMFGEFGSLYSGKTDPAFTRMIECGEYADLQGHNAFKELLQKAETNIIEQRHSSSNAQHSYDQKYGLVLYPQMQETPLVQEQLAPNTVLSH